MTHASSYGFEELWSAPNDRGLCKRPQGRMHRAPFSCQKCIRWTVVFKITRGSFRGAENLPSNRT